VEIGHDPGVAEGPRVSYRSDVWDNDRWRRFSLRGGDIIISSPVKSGTTWMQMICALLVLQRTTFDRPLDLISPWLEMQTRAIGDVIGDLQAQRHRRFLKSHTPRDGLPDDASVTYICVGRDPRDVAISWARHQDNLNLEALFTARAAALFTARAAASLDSMRARADEIAPDASEGILQSNRAFFHSGRNGQWRELLDDDGRRRYAERVRQLAPTDLIEWAHHESIEDLLAR
jgi:sulfotransferase family protein